MPNSTINLLAAIRSGSDFGSILAMSLLPMLATLVSFYYEVMPHITYVGAKALMVMLPIWVWRRHGLDGDGILRRAGFTRTNGIAGIASGLVLGGIVLGAYYLFFAGNLDPAPIQAKLSSLGLAERFWVAGMFICLLNSGLEEWFWRGFILERMHQSMSAAKAIALSSLLFGAHHYFTLLPYFDAGLAAFFTCGTMAAGAVWAFMRIRGASLVDCWISHIMADLAIISVGWMLLRQVIG